MNEKHPKQREKVNVFTVRKSLARDGWTTSFFYCQPASYSFCIFYRVIIQPSIFFYKRDGTLVLFFLRVEFTKIFKPQSLNWSLVAFSRVRLNKAKKLWCAIRGMGKEEVATPCCRLTIMIICLLLNQV